MKLAGGALKHIIAFSASLMCRAECRPAAAPA